VPATSRGSRWRPGQFEILVQALVESGLGSKHSPDSRSVGLIFRFIRAARTSSNRLSLRRATFFSVVMSFSVRGLNVVRNTILTSPEGGMATPLGVAQTRDGPRPERVAYCQVITVSTQPGVPLKGPRAAPHVGLGSGPPDFCPCTLKVPMSAVGSGSGRPEPARPMSQLGRASPFRAGGGKVRNRRIFVIAGRSGEGPLTEPTAAARPWQREPLTFAGHQHPVLPTCGLLVQYPTRDPRSSCCGGGYPINNRCALGQGFERGAGVKASFATAQASTRSGTISLPFVSGPR
jgi:hypothetical protein